MDKRWEFRNDILNHYINAGSIKTFQDAEDRLNFLETKYSAAKNKKLRVWWNPQVGQVDKAFYVPVDTPEEGKKVLDILAAYDAYQLQNRIKPDYCNCGGLQMYDSETEEWEDWYLETDDDYFDDVYEYIDSLENMEKFDGFTSELFKQIDWDIM